MPEERKQKVRKRFHLFLRLCVVAVACFLIFKNLDYQQFISSFRHLRGWVICTAAAAKILTEAGMAFRWWILLRALGIAIPLRSAVRLHFHGLFFSGFLPSSTGGDFVRAWYVTRHTDKRGLSALSVFADRFTGLFSTFLIAAVSFIVFFRGRSFLGGRREELSWKVSSHQIWIYVLLAVLVLLLVFSLFSRRTRDRFTQFFKFLKKIGGKLFLYTREIISVYFKKWWLFPLMVFITVLFQSLTFVSFWLIGMDLGVSGQLKHYFVFFPLVWVIGVIPVSIAGLGILEGGVVLLFVNSAGASAESAAALAVCQRALFLFGSIPGVFIHLKADYLPKTKEHIFY
ncbi:MAG TPA: lysylphosphatidylglycerol synthase transmembrane domain-containing protein [Anaerohalosphaeraceae bacterium]|nr:lysylphosphatidylglycerol synthase transmembrane domain-containing protein [Anaerohalosphaeraceae bacterium]HPP55432.1 lysylphosphatidylglycerol synthase transmembrane domain-containing protein [Anaerohalosphaeraceae bacterium]